MTGLLFLCAANSARSQMAEGLARAKYGARVRIQSAGSRPSQVNPLAVEVMAEVGIDITGHRSKSVDTIDPTTVDTVVTLCAEEVCPGFLRVARQVHWALPDPGASTGSRDERRERFRGVRDDIGRRLRDLDVTTSRRGDHATPGPR